MANANVTILERGNMNYPEYGYYLIKHYNHSEIQLALFNGTNFELFLSDKFINDEIEWYKKIDATQLINSIKPQIEALEKENADLKSQAEADKLDIETLNKMVVELRGIIKETFENLKLNNGKGLGITATRHLQKSYKAISGEKGA